MPINKQQAQQYLKTFDFKSLFIEELGWDNYKAKPLYISIDKQTYTLRGLVEKRGVVVYICEPDSHGALPDAPLRRKIEKEITKFTYEHVIIYIDAQKEHQVWQWIRRESGKPIAIREIPFSKKQTGESLLQKILAIAFELSEEENLTTTHVTEGVRKAFDVDRVTRRFYDRFKTEHAAFLKFIQGIPSDSDREWYASLMLNRLMFVYFIQKKGFLDGNTNYLPDRLQMIQERKGKDVFLSFYRHFLLRLFHEGLGRQEHSPELEALIGKVPYLNGGLFDVHELERDNDNIQIADEAFEKLFAFFDSYQWHLDERPLRADNEINPDVLGYIFEKYINQKQMGAYYTKEDITEYISKNTIIPFLFEVAQEKCEIAFQPEGAVWRLLRDDPDRYIYPAVKKGVELPLPPEIAVGLDDVSKRSEWNKPAPEEYALPTEIWREIVARRKRYEEVRTRLAAGEVHSINDLITYNLDNRQFAQDVIESSEGPELVRAFYSSITNITVLDPTCGSGAFLFAALNILKQLYEACLERMQSMVSDRDRLDDHARPSERKVSRQSLSDFRATLKQIEQHPNRDYFILKSIIINNLYGVDIMEEATEICKLRLFLKLAAQVEMDVSKPNYGLEPLPDIDFNIRAGNTLVGFATYAEVEKALGNDLRSKLVSDETMKRIEQKAQEVERGFENFRKLQTEIDIDPLAMTDMKRQLRLQLKELDAELDRYLAGEYGIDPHNIPKQEDYEVKFAQWRLSHQPFHWFVEFYGIMKSGGFDVIIGNPPYLDLKDLPSYSVKGFSTVVTRNLYSLILERSQHLVSKQGRQGYIVPVSSIATEGYSELQQVLARRQLAFSSYDDRPAHLFDGLDKNTLSILLLSSSVGEFNALSTRLCRWNAEERSSLFSVLQYEVTPKLELKGCLPKIGSSIEATIWHKLFRSGKPLASFYAQKSGSITYYSRKVNAFLQVLDFVPEVRDGLGKLRPPSEFKELLFSSDGQAAATFCCLNSTLFRWFLDVVSDGSHLNRREVDSFPFDPAEASSTFPELGGLAKRLSKSLQLTSLHRVMRYKHDTLTVQCIIPKYSKPIIDGIDRMLAQHYGFTDEELDFIINYDIKYRMGRDGGENDEE